MSRPGPGVLFVRTGSTCGSKKNGARRSISASNDSPARCGKRAPRPAAARAAAPRSAGRQAQQELARRDVVVWTGVEPEQLRVAADLGDRRRVHVLVVREDRFKDLPHLEIVGVALVVKDVAPGEGGKRKMPDKDLVAKRQRREAVGVKLDHGCLIDTLQQVTSIRICRQARKAPVTRAPPKLLFSPDARARGRPAAQLLPNQCPPVGVANGRGACGWSRPSESGFSHSLSAFRTSSVGAAHGRRPGPLRPGLSSGP